MADLDLTCQFCGVMLHSKTTDINFCWVCGKANPVHPSLVVIGDSSGKLLTFYMTTFVVLITDSF